MGKSDPNFRMGQNPIRTEKLLKKMKKIKTPHTPTTATGTVQAKEVQEDANYAPLNSALSKPCGRAAPETISSPHLRRDPASFDVFCSTSDQKSVPQWAGQRPPPPPTPTSGGQSASMDSVTRGETQEKIRRAPAKGENCIDKVSGS